MRPFLAVLVAVVALSGCSGPVSYEQTWPKSYERTTCAEWQRTMSDEQQFAAAGDLLRAHLKRNGGDERPSLASIQDFAAVLGQGCANHSTSTVAEIGNGIALPD